MARAWRIEYEGALYHVLSRGNEQGPIVLADDDRILFLKTLGEMSERFQVDVCAYVLMDNHYHLLLRTNRDNLSKSMQWFGATYTKRFNIRHSRSGHLFQGRFKNMLIQNDAYLLQLSYYIHRNPLRAGMVKRLSTHRWSSYRAYAYGKNKQPWLNTDVILSQLVNVEDAHKTYRQNAQKYAKEEDWVWEDLRHGMFLGSKKFVEKIKRKYLPETPHAEFPEQRRLGKSIDPQAVLLQGAKLLSVDLKRFKSSARISRRDRDDRDLLIYLLWQLGMLTNEQIGEKFGLTYSAVSKRVGLFKTKLENDKSVRKKFNSIQAQIQI